MELSKANELVPVPEKISETVAFQSTIPVPMSRYNYRRSLADFPTPKLPAFIDLAEPRQKKKSPFVLAMEAASNQWPLAQPHQSVEAAVRSSRNHAM